MDKPDVDSIEGLSPAISIDQKTTSRNPRSTVGTVTEIYDYLRLLWARVGTPHCPECGGVIEGQSAEQIIDQVMAFDEGTRFMVLAPVVRGRKGEYGKLLEELRPRATPASRSTATCGCSRRRSSSTRSSSTTSRSWSTGSSCGPRCASAWPTRSRPRSGWRRDRRGRGLGGDTPEVKTFSERFACLSCGTSMPELEPRIFSFNSPHGACDRCTGLGSMMEIDPELVVPDGSLSIGEGALRPWATSTSAYYEQVTQAIAERYRSTSSARGALSERPAELFLYGTNGDRIQVSYRNRYGRSARTPRSSRASSRTSSAATARRTPSCSGEDRGVHVDGARARCARARACGRSRARCASAAWASTSSAALGAQRATWLDEVELTDQQRRIARLILREIEERCASSTTSGIGYLSMDRAAATLSGGEAQRIRLATQIGSALVGVLYVLDEPSIGLHQRDNSKLIGTLERLRDLGNTVLGRSSTTSRRCSLADHLVDLGPARASTAAA
jgi:excinuclease ABC subunit A